MKTFVSSLLDISTSDPDDARRRKILNILLLGVEVLTLLIIVSLVIFSFLGYGDRIVNYIWWVAIGLLIGVAFLWKINRNPALPGWISSTMFLILLSAILPFTDTVVELAAGRSLFVFTIPVILSSMLLRPASSFIFASLP
jgi:hypothetical protein